MKFYTQGSLDPTGVNAGVDSLLGTPVPEYASSSAHISRAAALTALYEQAGLASLDALAGEGQMDNEGSLVILRESASLHLQIAMAMRA
jgi:hypothetical protein